MAFLRFTSLADGILGKAPYWILLTRHVFGLRLFIHALILAGMLSSPMTVWAADTFDSRADFDAAAAGTLEVLNFDSLADLTEIAQNDTLNVGPTVGDATFTYNDSEGDVALEVHDGNDTTSSPNYLGVDWKGAEDTFAQGDWVTLTFAQPVQGIGLYILMTGDALDNDVSLAVDDGTAYNTTTLIQTLPDNTKVHFVGIRDTSGFTSATFTVLEAIPLDIDDIVVEAMSGSPEMDVEGNGTSIPDNDTTPQVADHTDFGGVSIGSFFERTFTIQNEGNAPLTLSNHPSAVQLSSNPSGDFSIETQPASGSVAASGSETFVVRCTPDGTGDRTATVSIANTDADENPYNFDIECNGTDTDPPDVSSIVRADANPTNAASVDFTVTFDESVTGVDATDFTLDASGITGASIGVVSGSGTTYTVPVNTGTGDGTLSIDLVDDDTIEDGSGNKLGGTGAGNGNYTAGEVYTIDKTDPTDPTPSSASHTVNVPSNDNTVDIQVSDDASDGSGSGVDGFEIEWDKSATWTPTETKEQDGTWAGATFTATSDGDWYFHLATVDNAGNWTSTVHMGPFPIDTDKPDVTINQAGGQADPTNGSPVLFSVVFDEPINDATFTNADVSVGGTATTGTVTVTEVAPNDDTTFEVSIVVTGDGTVQPSIPAGGVEDLAGNTNNASTSTDNSVTYDTTKPEVTINQAGGQADPTNASPVLFTVVFDEPINEATFTNADVSVGGTATTGTVTVTEVAPNDDTTFEVSIVVTADGTVQPTIPAGGVEDLVGNTNNASTSTDNSVTVETVKPDVTINQKGGQADPTNSSPVLFTVELNEPIDDTTFTNTDVSVGGTATTGAVTVTEISPNDDTTFEVSIVVTGDGTVVPTIPAGGVEDPAGNTNNASTSTDNVVTYDATAPQILSITSTTPDGSYGVGSTIDVTVTFTESVTMTNIIQIVLDTGVTVNLMPFGPATTSSTTYTVDTGDTSDDLQVNVFALNGPLVDAAGNVTSPFVGTPVTNIDDGSDIVIDTEVPYIISIDRASGQALSTGLSPVVFDVLFHEPIAEATFTGADMDLDIIGNVTTGAITIAEIAPNDDTRFEVSVAVVSGEGYISATIPAGAVEDAAGNTNNASEDFDNQVYVDLVKPSATVNQAQEHVQPDPTNISPVRFWIDFDESIDSLTEADLDIGGSATTGGITICSFHDNTVFDVFIEVLTDGTVELTLPAGRVQDLYGNTNNASTSTDNSVTYDTTGPNVTIEQADVQSDPTNSSPVVFTVAFNEPINEATFTSADVSVGGTATTGTVTVTEVAPNDDTTFEVSIVVTGDGTVQPTIPAGGVEDVAGNTNNASTSTDNSVTVDITQPDVTINQAGGQADPTDNSPVFFTAVFNEPINTATFTDADVNIGGTATTGAVTVAEEDPPNDGTTFSVSVEVTTDGTVIADILVGGVEDLAGNTNSVLESTDNTVIYDGLPDVTTVSVTGETNHSATANCTITDLGVSDPTAHGVVWNLAGGPDPTLADNSTDEGPVGAVTVPFAFTSNVTGLDRNTTYAVRAYATNDAGTAYGDVLTFTTLPSALPPVYYLLDDEEPDSRRR
ncbi:MAG: choice-of-anchor D domain-containing protein [Thermodesulfobacteriota bacterium]|nr:choice-of-anchor D domain-containing protein [Thermodesulfobacteriota bacterium]